MKVFLSSVQHGLREEREAATSLMRALSHEVVRFEDFGALDATSRAACLSKITGVDVYVLLLGPHYGTRWPDTNLSATEEEFNAARSLGKPRLVFRKVGIEMDPDEEEFARRVGSYQDGRFWQDFEGIADLGPALLSALQNLPAPHVEPEWRAVAPRSVDRLHGGSSNQGPGGHMHSVVLEVQVVPEYAGSRRPLMGRARLREQVVERARATRLVDSLAPLVEVDTPDALHIQRPSETGRGGFQTVDHDPYCGICVSDDGAVAAYQALPADGLGTITNEMDLRERVHLLLDQIVPVLPERSPAFIVSASLSSAWRTALGDPAEMGRRSSASLAMDQGAVILPADSCVSREALVSTPVAIAEEIAARLVHALQKVR